MTSPSPRVARLGALEFDVTDISGWRRILIDLLGMEERPTDSDGAMRVRLDEHAHRLSFFPAKADRVRRIVWDIESVDELHQMAARVEAAGIPVQWNQHPGNDAREWVEAFSFTDPEGFPLQMRYGATLDHNEFRPRGVISGFVTGELGLGHIVLICKDYPGTTKFYNDVLGFRISDYIVWDGADATFFHVNGRHHSLALMNECFGQQGGQFNHFMLEARDLDDTGRAYHKIKEAGVPLSMDFGRHTNDGVTSFYFRTPSGFQMEVGSGGLLVNDDNWRVKTWRAPARWGHQPVL